jgi:HK97 family phage portal protein
VLSRFGSDNLTGDVMHIKLRTGGGLRGLSPISLARQAIGLSIVTEKFGSEFFGRGQQMSVVIELPAEVKSSKEHIELIRASWEQAHAGSDMAHRPAVITGGAKWTGITIPPEDAQFLETRKFEVEDIATRFYGVPAHMVGLEEKNTSWGSGVEAMTRGFFTTTMLPHFVRFESAHSMLLPRGQFLRLNQRALLRADSKTESEILIANLLNGVWNFDDVRAKYDLPPRPGGSRYMVPLNMQILEGNGKPPAPEPVPAELNPNGQGGTNEPIAN